MFATEIVLKQQCLYTYACTVLWKPRRAIFTVSALYFGGETRTYSRLVSLQSSNSANITRALKSTYPCACTHCTAFTISSAAWSMQCNRASTCKFYDMTTVTYNKLEHAQLKPYRHTYSVDVVNRRGRTKVQFVAFVVLIICFEARLRHFFASCETFIALVTR